MNSNNFYYTPIIKKQMNHIFYSYIFKERSLVHLKLVCNYIPNCKFVDFEGAVEYNVEVIE